MNKLTFSIIVIAILSLSALGQTDTTDTQFWNETSVEFKLPKKDVTGVIIGNLRFTDDISDLSDRRIGFAIKFKQIKNLTITPSYIFRHQPRTGDDRFEHRLRLDITPKFTVDRVTIENRSRFEHRLKTDGRDDDTFYRNRTKVKIPVTKDDKTIFTPFVSNDTYFDLQNTRVHRNDFVGGVSRKISSILTTDFFYQYRREFQSSTKHKNIFGVNLKFKVP